MMIDNGNQPDLPLTAAKEKVEHRAKRNAVAAPVYCERCGGKIDKERRAVRLTVCRTCFAGWPTDTDEVTG